ncbi:sugar transferase [Rubrivivax albus]|uniref:Sugar transferase n=1 Tax=Rubrivivax albus TaxID=2499835 RepID=A0A437JWM0_9BURK|nr:sugar transferase [Rubrivivax albus]RVT52061.1 sugar transferase [Rubrivivax albus]
MAKRLFDVLLAGMGLLLSWPLLLLLAVWVRLDSPGPALYRQLRVGRCGVPFRIRKFRTMFVDAGGPPLTVGDDPRITRAGRMLRRTRLDELPQLLDVLQGTMSLVGPRPEVPRYMDAAPADLKARVLAVRPGMTDPVAVAHLDESALLAQAADPEQVYRDVLLPAKLRAAAEYADRATLATDLQVLWRTASALWWGRAR